MAETRHLQLVNSNIKISAETRSSQNRQLLPTAYTWEVVADLEAVVDLEAVAHCRQRWTLNASAATCGQTQKELCGHTFLEEADLAAAVDCRQSRNGVKQLEQPPDTSVDISDLHAAFSSASHLGGGGGPGGGGFGGGGGLQAAADMGVRALPSGDRQTEDCILLDPHTVYLSGGGGFGGGGGLQADQERTRVS